MKNKLLFILIAVVVNFLATVTTNASVNSVLAGTGCVSASKAALEGTSFTIGYKTTFETINGTDVKITFELLDTDKAGVVEPDLRKFGDPVQSQVKMVRVSGNIFTKTITAQTPGEIIKYGCNFVYSGGNSVTDFVSYEVGTDCAATNDIVAPTGFTATIGAITSSSVEIVLNATDVSGTVLYSVSYGAVTKSTTSASGVPKTFVMTALTPETDYNFSVTAKDLVGNIASTTYLLPAKTLVSTNTECAGTASEAFDGSFTVGYKYAFQTINGTDVKLTFELLDNKTVELAYYRTDTPNFSENPTPMTKTGNIVTSTITGQTPETTIRYGVKFVFVGGAAAATKFFSYKVGNTCSLGLETSSELKQTFYPNPVKNKFFMQLLDEKNKIMVTDILGRKIVEDVVSASNTLDMSSYRAGVYFMKVENTHGIQNVKIIKE